MGFGAHHWRVDVGGEPGLFATYDRFGKRHSLDSLEAAYAGAIQLADAGLEFVLAPLPARSGRGAGAGGERERSAARPGSTVRWWGTGP